MKEAIQKIHNICSGQKYCQDCPFFDPFAATPDETCILESSPDTWDVDEIVNILEKLS